MTWEARMLKDRASHHKWVPTGALDPYGAPIGAFQPVLAAPVYTVPCFMAWTASRTRTPEGEDVVVKGWRCAVSASYQVELNERDRIQWAGRVFEVSGIGEGRRPGELHHYVLDLLEVDAE